eukprot:TRINITY_DN116_c0_g1_i5.p1 TRINITY_DN116_c0_g1~~TRINITY_DN116_c0_g1_i5.p1  ORF type:complete len:619 (+),score=199.34 TRINITY_DN116_c0_g1_i5:55-1911(+)
MTIEENNMTTTPDTAPYASNDIEAQPENDSASPSPFHGKDTEPITLRWQGLTFDVPIGKNETKTILKNVSGMIRPGELTAIMGPSGAGKSTLMNVLAGRAPYGTASGTVSLNGEAVAPETYRKKLAYVMQKDALFATQTPRECLHFTAALKLPDSSDEEREKLVDGAITTLGLQRCADTMIGSVMMPGLSGGEMKRAAVAVELISSPSLIFLDEPTSGLDSHNAFELIKVLKGLAEQGCTIVCTIHQPSSEVFDLFHRVMFLRLGQMVYNGTVEGVVEHFAAQGHHCKPNYNPADFAMQKLQTLTDEEIQPLASAVTPVKCSSQIEGISNGFFAERSAPFLTQVRLLVVREWYQFIRDKMTLGARFGMNLFVALLCGLLYLGAGNEWGGDSTDLQEIEKDINNHTGGLFFISMSCLFLAVQPLLIVFPIERPVFMREYTTGTYGTTAYSLAKTIVEVPTHFLQQITAAVIYYFMMDLQGNFIYIVVSLTLLAVASSSMALLLGASTGSVETAVNVMPALLVPQILFGGFFISIDSVPSWCRWLSWVMPLRYGFGLVTAAEFSHEAVPDYRESFGDDIFRRYEISRDSWWWYVIVLFGLTLAFRILAAVMLSMNSKKFK